MPVPYDRRFLKKRIVDADVRKGWRYWSAVPLMMLEDELRRRDTDRAREADLIRTDFLKKTRVRSSGQLHDRTGIAVSKYQNRRSTLARTECRPIDLPCSNEAATDYVLLRPIPERLRNRTAAPPQLYLKRAWQLCESFRIQADCCSVRFCPCVTRWELRASRDR